MDETSTLYGKVWDATNSPVMETNRPVGLPTRRWVTLSELPSPDGRGPHGHVSYNAHSLHEFLHTEFFH